PASQRPRHPAYPRTAQAIRWDGRLPIHSQLFDRKDAMVKELTGRIEKGAFDVIPLERAFPAMEDGTGRPRQKKCPPLSWNYQSFWLFARARIPECFTRHPAQAASLLVWASVSQSVCWRIPRGDPARSTLTHRIGPALLNLS